MKKLALLAIGLLSLMRLQGQTFGNEWLDFSSTYFKFPITRTGFYRIDSAALATGFNLNGVNPKQFRIFFQGKELPLYVQGEQDNVFNNGDFIEFYANPSAMYVDSMLYNSIGYLPNPDVPLVRDSVYAFIHVSGGVPGLRLTEVTDTIATGLSAENYFYTEARIGENSAYNFVNDLDPQGLVSDPVYTQAEGPGSSFDKGNSYVHQFQQINTYSAAALPVLLDVRFSGASKQFLTAIDHHIQTYVTDGGGNSVMLADTSLQGVAPVRKKFLLSSGNLGSSMTLSLVSVADPSFSSFNNTTIFHQATLWYPHTMDMAAALEARMWLNDATSASKVRLDLTNLNGGASVCHDLTNGRRITVKTAGGIARLVVPNGGGKKLCVLASTSSIVNITLMRKSTSSGRYTDYSSQAKPHPFLIVHATSFSVEAQQYAAYRSSPNGGNHQVMAVDVNELYDQYGYGFRSHPFALRNFFSKMISAGNAPSYVFLIGKAVEHPLVQSGYQPENLVPTMGIPSSDVLLASALTPSGSPYYPEFPIGRIAAVTSNEITDYLEKVKEAETSLDQEWKKQVLHFIGGDNDALQNTITSYMDNYKAVVTNTLLGAEVFSFSKKTSAPIETNVTDSVRHLINNGSALMNVFGHGSQQGFDQAIDDPNLYNNTGRYPMFIANSCFSGDIHVPGFPSVSEKFVFAKRKGSIGFLASAGFGLDYALNYFTQNYYDALSGDYFNRGIGEIARAASMKCMQTGDRFIRITGIDMTLHGDPAVPITGFTSPDYQVTNGDMRIDLGKSIDSVGIRLRYKNTGKAVNDTMSIRVIRILATGDTMKVERKVKAPFYHDSLVVSMPLDFDRGFGLNRFSAIIDDGNHIPEKLEDNNVLPLFDYFIPGADLVPVYPYPFAVVPKNSSYTLKASTTDPFAPESKYIFQLDTVGNFSNPILSTTIRSAGGVIEWKVALPFADSTVVYWRVSRDSTSASSKFSWRESSFQIIGNQHGWGQAAFMQHKNNRLQYLQFNRNLRRFDFVRTRNAVSCRTGIFPYLHISLMNFYFNNQISDAWSSAFDGWNFAVFDSISGEPIVVKPINPGADKSPGPYNCCLEHGARTVYSFGAANACGITTWKSDMENFLAAVPANCWILGYTTGFHDYNHYSDIYSYNSHLLDLFESVGAKKIRKTTDSVAYCFLGRKSSAVSHEEIGKNRAAIIYLNDSVPVNWSGGAIVSEKIGPSYGWKTLRWQVRKTESMPGDSSFLKVIGIDRNGKADTLFSIPQDSTTADLASHVNADTYPYIQLVAYLTDKINRTAPQLKSWHVLYDQAPDAAVNPLKGYSADNNSLQEGDKVTFRFPIENISDVSFRDSLAITYWVNDAALKRTDLPTHFIPPGFPGGAVWVDTLKVNSYQLKGANNVWLNVNPINERHHQDEQYSINNIATRGFTVSVDVTNPLLDVTFDGMRILNGDLVSAKPIIAVTLKDENKFLAINDTSSFTLRLRSPGGDFHNIYFAQGIEFTPAQLPRNSASLRYQPTLQVDGRYTLAVQARDRSNNKSAASEYVIDFEVYNKPTITNVLNYPNPFTTSTRFVFTLSGSEIPEVFTIQIMTITGKVVREITRAELGEIHIGRNITDFAWNGTDQYGDRLGNGVYLYRVVTRLNGQSIEKNSNETDKYFVREFGKMVLMR